MLSIWWLSLVAFLLSLSFIRPLRRLLLFIASYVVGHAWLLYRRLTAHTTSRQEKRAYLEQNPAWREYAAMTHEERAKEKRRRELGPPGKTTPVPKPGRMITSNGIASPAVPPLALTSSPSPSPSTPGTPAVRLSPAQVRHYQATGATRLMELAQRLEAPRNKLQESVAEGGAIVFDAIADSLRGSAKKPQHHHPKQGSDPAPSSGGWFTRKPKPAPASTTTPVYSFNGKVFS